MQPVWNPIGPILFKQLSMEKLGFEHAKCHIRKTFFPQFTHANLINIAAVAGNHIWNSRTIAAADHYRFIVKIFDIIAISSKKFRFNLRWYVCTAYSKHRFRSSDQHRKATRFLQIFSNQEKFCFMGLFVLSAQSGPVHRASGTSRTSVRCPRWYRGLGHQQAGLSPCKSWKCCKPWLTPLGRESIVETGKRETK